MIGSWLGHRLLFASLDNWTLVHMDEEAADENLGQKSLFGKEAGVYSQLCYCWAD